MELSGHGWQLSRKREKGITAAFYPLPRLRGRVGVGAIRNKCAKDCGEHIIRLNQHLVIPEAQYTKALIFQPIAPNCVGC